MRSRPSILLCPFCPSRRSAVSLRLWGERRARLSVAGTSCEMAWWRGPQDLQGDSGSSQGNALSAGPRRGMRVGTGGSGGAGTSGAGERRRKTAGQSQWLGQRSGRSRKLSSSDRARRPCPVGVPGPAQLLGRFGLGPPWHSPRSRVPRSGPEGRGAQLRLPCSWPPVWPPRPVRSCSPSTSGASGRRRVISRSAAGGPTWLPG